MDYHALQQKLFQIEPSNPAEDLAKLRAQANNPQESVAPTKDYVQESVEVPQGSMPLGIDNVDEFAALAGVRIDEKQKMGSAGQLKAMDAITTKSKPGGNETPHPARNKLVGEDDDLFEPLKIDLGPEDAMGKAQWDLQQGIKLIAEGSAMIDAAQKKIKEITSTLTDRTLTKGEEKDKEKYVKGMKKNKSDFKDRYGKDAEAVMYATATKMAKKESIETSLHSQLMAKLKDL